MHCDPAALEELKAEADAELASFRGRMTTEAYERARAACVDRLIRDRTRLPVVSFE
jgi:hypothetical protein